LSEQILTALRRAASFLEEARIDYMLIGGYALPFYGMIRATLDIDLAIAIRSEAQFEAFQKAAENAGFTLTLGSFREPESIFLDQETGLEIEFWIRLDGVEWNEETLARRQRKKIDEFEMWVISPEDFIVNKLARPDRGVQDEKDVKSVLVRLHDELDQDYLEQRAKRAGVLSLLKVIDETK